MKLEKPIVSLDVETTGTNVTTDRIVSLGMLKTKPDGSCDRYYSVFNPGVIMSDENIAVHGISNDQALASHKFEIHAKKIQEFISGCDLCGFNLLNFDVPILYEEMLRSGIEMDLSTTRVIDAGNIFKKKEERTLSAAVQFYLNRNHDGAHNSFSDCSETYEVLIAQIQRYPDLTAMTAQQLAEFSQFEPRVDLAGKIILDKDGDPAYSFGQNTKGVKVRDNTGFAYWMLGKDFPSQTKAVLRKILNSQSRNLL